MVYLNRKNLSEEFDLEYVEAEVEEVEEEIKGPNIPDQILFANILRANRILDKIENEFNSNNFSARLCEVASQLINSVTSATSQVMTDDYNKAYLQVRQDLVKLKEREIKIKQLAAGTPRSQNLIVTDRESIMKILKKDSDKEEPLDQIKQIEE